MQFTHTNSRRGAGVASALAVVVAVVAGCTAPVPMAKTETLEVAGPVVQRQEPVAPTISMPAANVPAVPAVPTPSEATSEAVTQPVPRRRPVPRYPPDLAETGMAGTVVVSFAIGAQGRPEDVRIESSSHPMFTKEVRAVLPQWRFEPARDAAGRVVRQRMRVPFRFLQED